MKTNTNIKPTHNRQPADQDEVLVRVNGVSKKFARNLKSSLRYGVQDIAREVLGKPRKTNLRKSEFWAVKDVSFELKRGECLGLIGHNGAGKSTLLKMLNGLIKPDEGRIEMHGRVAALIELGAGFNPLLSGRENIYNNASVLGFSKAEVDAKLQDIIDFAEIAEAIDAPVQSYSSGMKVRLGFAIAAQMEPDILIVDEVLAVGDMGFKIKCLNRISQLLQNTCVIFVTHSMPMLARICTDITLLEGGQNIFSSKDVALGIDLYLKKFHSSAKSIQGSGEVVVTNLKIQNPIDGSFCNDLKQSFSTYDTLVLKVKLDIHESVKDFTLGVAIFDIQLREVLNSSSNIGNIVFNRSGAEKEILITLPNITFSSGKYQITIAATCPETRKFYCRESNVAEFTVNAVANAWATNVVPGIWEEIR